MAKFYVYIHKKKTNGEVFYVGKGSTNRAFRGSSKRSMWWNNVVNKHGLIVEIIEEGLKEEDALSLEMQLIKKYGRKDLGLGTLVNMTNGGDGVSGYKLTEEHREIVSNAQKGNTYRRGVKLTEQTINKIKLNRIGKGGCVLLDTESGVFYNSVREAAELYGIKERTLNNWLSGISPNKSNLIKV